MAPEVISGFIFHMGSESGRRAETGRSYTVSLFGEATILRVFPENKRFEVLEGPQGRVNSHSIMNFIDYLRGKNIAADRTS